jgi:hypothetical protein
MILIQRIAEKQLIHSGVNSINSCTAASSSAVRSVASAPGAAAKEEDSGGKQTRRSCSY